MAEATNTAGDLRRPEMAFHDCTVPGEVTARNRATIAAAFDAIAAGDSGPFQALWSPDIVFHEADCLPYGGAHHGIAAVKAAHGRIHATFDQLHSVVEQLLAAGDLVIAYVTLTYRVRANGRTGTMPLCELVRMEGGQIIEWRALYFDAQRIAGDIAGD